MDIHKQIFFSMETFKKLEHLGKLDNNSVNVQCVLAIDSYLMMRNLPKELQQVLLQLFKDPTQYKVNSTQIDSLKKLSEKDKTTVNIQVESALSTYLTIRSLPEKAENEIHDLISHHQNRGCDDGH